MSDVTGSDRAGRAFFQQAVRLSCILTMTQESIGKAIGQSISGAFQAEGRLDRQDDYLIDLERRIAVIEDRLGIPHPGPVPYRRSRGEGPHVCQQTTNPSSQRQAPDWRMCFNCKSLIAAGSICSQCGVDNSRPPAPELASPRPKKLSAAQYEGRACVYCAAEDQPMRPNAAWGEPNTGLFECIDAIACETRVEEQLEEYLEAQSIAEADTMAEFQEQERREAEEEERPLSLDVLLDNEEL